MKNFVSHPETRFRVVYRSANNAPWVTLADYKWDEDGIDPRAFEFDNRTLLVSRVGDGDTDALYTYDPERKQIKGLAFRHAEADVGPFWFSDQKRAITGVACE